VSFDPKASNLLLAKRPFQCQGYETLLASATTNNATLANMALLLLPAGSLGDHISPLVPLATHTLPWCNPLLLSPTSSTATAAAASIPSITTSKGAACSSLHLRPPLPHLSKLLVLQS